MPPKRHPYGRKKEPKPPGPVVFGPPLPPPPDPPSVSATDPQAADQPGAQDTKPRHRRKKLPRKKIGKDTKGGWDDDLDEREPHPDDEGRYDQDVPYDLRLLRCCDEFRSLRSLGHPDRRVVYQAVLRFFQINVPVLRAKYGSQPLRGYDPEPDDVDSDDGDDNDGGDGGENELLETKIEEIVERSEDEWAKVVFALPRLAKFFDNRYNDAYTPTLSLAPPVIKSFFRFLAARDVIPGHNAGIEACVDVCNVAAKQLHPVQRLFKEVINASQLGPAVKRLFPSPDSTLSSPIVVVPDFVARPADVLPDVFSNVSLAAPDSDSDDDADEAQPRSSATAAAVPERSWPDAHRAPADAPPTDPEDATRQRLERIRAQFEREAEAQRAWEDAERAHRPRSSTAVLKAVVDTAQLAVGEGASSESEPEQEGTWRVGHKERCARELRGWELVAPAAASDGRRLVRLHLGPHERNFPLDASHEFPPLATREAVAALGGGQDAATLERDSSDSPLSLVVDLGESFNVSHLDALVSPPAVLECDLAQLVFVPFHSSPSSSSPRVAELWTLAALHRLLPAYWRHGGELLRGDPGRPLSFPGEGYEVASEEAHEELGAEASRVG
ncbi:uncharacterized protein RHOBADRAFT_44499 [Rhodotorula graminis WP1]|uniref:Uncharacterized protein n=1 Tax=Rhodotorula graminis (strain WP1) TaxID=578459 RepID=A0A194S321_RHOGW|nr:uncharacterized protein RHOBADRAFT_44499 [Rhodotorula graminis WP1]KPV74982.1 hypothetical protein RHOBADRAFT_44499 [Rhodotorula graminis WP1]